jgi:Lar family restriction alleviation protein
MKHPKLKPCPFCGGIDIRIIADPTYSHRVVFLRCFACYASTAPSSVELNAVLNWNRRHEKYAACESVRREGETKLENAVSERDAAEDAVSQIYFIVTGHSPEWSNTFGFEQAIQEIEEAINLLKQAAKTNAVLNKTKLFPQV